MSAALQTPYYHTSPYLQPAIPYLQPAAPNFHQPAATPFLHPLARPAVYSASPHLDPLAISYSMDPYRGMVDGSYPLF